MTLQKILEEEYKIDIEPDKRDRFKSHHYSNKIAEKLKGYVRLEDSYCNYGCDSTSRFDVPSLPGGKIYVSEIRDEKLAISCGFRPKRVNIILEYLENANQGDLAEIKLAIKDSLKEE